MAREPGPIKSDPLAVGRHCGERIWGYEVLANGNIKLAPMITDRFLTLSDRFQAIEDMQSSALRFASGELARLSAEKRKLWAEIRADLGDLEGYSMDIRHGELNPPKQEADSQESD